MVRKYVANQLDLVLFKRCRQMIREQVSGKGSLQMNTSGALPLLNLSRGTISQQDISAARPNGFPLPITTTATYQSIPFTKSCSDRDDS